MRPIHPNMTPRLTNLDHLEEGNVGTRARHARIDTKAIIAVKSQIQSIAMAQTWRVEKRHGPPPEPLPPMDDPEPALPSPVSLQGRPRRLACPFMLRI